MDGWMKYKACYGRAMSEGQLLAMTNGVGGKAWEVQSLQ